MAMEQNTPKVAGLWNTSIQKPPLIVARLKNENQVSKNSLEQKK